jgi:hypothetical protein
VLVYLEIEKLSMFPGSALEWHENFVAKGDPTFALLEDSCAPKDELFLRRCLLGAGEAGNVAGSNPAAAGPRCYA